ncbi:hypothetical protein WDU94_005450 [Cyamophila willieti]
MQDGQQIDVIYTDIEKCFDKISHYAILNKLKDIGISPPLLELFSDYLKIRKTYVKYENTKSEPFSPPSGIAQGSKLSSLLFILTYNDIHKHITSSKYILYADDLKIYKPIRTEQDCRELQADLNAVNNWLESVGLNFHPDKCLKMTYTNKKSKVDYHYKIKDTLIHPTDTYKDLGVMFQSNLSFDKQIKDVTQRAYKKLGMIIRHCQSITDIDAILLLYLSIVRSTLEYGSVVWSPNTRKDTKSLERVQACFARYLFNKVEGFYPKYPHYIEYNLLIENLDMESLESRFINNQMKFIKNVLNNKIICSELLSKISIRANDPRTRPNNSTIFNVPPRKTTLLYKSPMISGMARYNSLREKPELFS